MNFLAAKIVAAGDGGVTVELLNHDGARLTQPLAGRCRQSEADVIVGVRPEHFGDAGEGDADITVKVDVAEHLGSTSYVYARTRQGGR